MAEIPAHHTFYQLHLHRRAESLAYFTGSPTLQCAIHNCYPNAILTKPIFRWFLHNLDVIVGATIAKEHVLPTFEPLHLTTARGHTLGIRLFLRNHMLLKFLPLYIGRY